MQSALVNISAALLYPTVVPRSDSSSVWNNRLAGRVECHLQQPKQYEAGSFQPTLNLIRKPGTARSVTSDQLHFGGYERGPNGDLRLQLKAVSRFDEVQKRIVRSLIEGMIPKHEARRGQTVSNGGERK